MAALCWSSCEEIPHAQGKKIGVARGHQRADTLKPYSQKTSQPNHTRTTALSNSVKLSHARGATQDGWVMVERSDRMWSTGEQNGNPLQYLAWRIPWMEEPDRLQSVTSQRVRHDWVTNTFFSFKTYIWLWNNSFGQKVCLTHILTSIVNVPGCLE